MKKNVIGFLLLLTSISIQAHQSDLSTVLINQDEKGRCFLQIYSSLNAFEGEVDYKYGKNAYKTPEEFRALVIDHFKKMFYLFVIQRTRSNLANPKCY